MDYRVMRATYENDAKEFMKVELYLAHPSKSNYKDTNKVYCQAPLCLTVVEYRKYREVEHLDLEDVFPRKTTVHATLKYITQSTVRSVI